MTAPQVWAAFAEIPDPEIPVVSLVDLGVIRAVDVDHGRVHVEFTPTFLGCPALELPSNRLLLGKGRGAHTDELAELWEEMTSVRRSAPAGSQW